MLRTLAFSLRRAIQLDYRIEEQEIAVELIGRERQRRLILWEAAEGATGSPSRVAASRDTSTAAKTRRPMNGRNRPLPQ